MNKTAIVCLVFGVPLTVWGILAILGASVITENPITNLFGELAGELGIILLGAIFVGFGLVILLMKNAVDSW